eukprot:2153994-Pleurochrysis_carterae.AAC.1
MMTRTREQPSNSKRSRQLESAQDGLVRPDPDEERAVGAHSAHDARIVCEALGKVDVVALALGEALADDGLGVLRVRAVHDVLLRTRLLRYVCFLCVLRLCECACECA